MKIGILQTGQTPPSLKEEHGDFVDMFETLFQAEGFSFRHYAVCEMKFPDNFDEQQGWLITGSKCGAYEDHPWIAPLEEFLRNAHRARVPIVGICFGHQIFAQSQGGKIEKYQGGWQVGMQRYDLTALQSASLSGLISIPAWHQDQVVEKPAAAEVLGCSAQCRYAALRYEDGRALTFQPHPEFTQAFLADLLALRKDILDPAVAAQAQESLAEENSGLAVAHYIADFYREAA